MYKLENQEFLDTIIFNNEIRSYVFVLIIFLIGFIFLKFFQPILIKNLKKIASNSEEGFDDFLVENIEKIVFPLLYFSVFYFSLSNLILNNIILKSLNSLGSILITFFGIKLFLSVLDRLLKNYWFKNISQDASKSKSLKGILILLKTFIWSLGIIFLLDNLGYKISSVIAGLGIGGVAVALAAQAVLADLFGYVVILLDKPFEVGELISIDDKTGTVEKIGIKTTKIRSVTGEQIIFSNSDITRSRIKNLKRMNFRRVIFQNIISFDTKEEDLKEIPEIIKNIIESNKEAIFERCHFLSFNNFGFLFETSYSIENCDFINHANIQHNINLSIVKEFSKKNIRFSVIDNKI